MAVSLMQKVRIFSHLSEKDALVEHLHDLGMVEVTSFKENYPESEYEKFVPSDFVPPRELEERISAIRAATDYLKGFEPDEGMLARLSGKKIMVSPEEYKQVTENLDHAPIVEECRDLERRRDELTSSIDKFQSLKEQLLPWTDIDIPLEKLKPTGKTDLAMGFMPTEQFVEFEKRISDVAEEAYIQLARQQGRETYFILYYLKEHREEVNQLLKRLEFTEVAFPKVEGTAREAVVDLERRIAKSNQELEGIARRSRQLVEHRPKLLVLVDHLSNLLAKSLVEQHFAQTNRAFMIEGWVRKKDLTKLEAILENNFETVSLVETEALPEEQPPIELENNGLSKPFEMVTDLYGRPQYAELDPTPLIAPFFAVFFALCLTDAGYGLVLSILTFIALKRFRLSGGVRKLCSLLFWSGILTIVAGAVTGGFFGIDFSKLPPDSWVVRAVYRLKLFDPLEDALTFFKLALVCGIAHVFTGFAAKMYSDIRAGQIAKGVLTQLPWMIMSVGLGIVMISYLGALNPSLIRFGQYALLVGAVGIVLFHGMGSRSVFAHAAKGLSGLYGVVSVFSDILSYSRLLALGLATAVIAGVIDVLAGMISHIPFIGIVAMVLLVVLGHLGFLAICCLGAFVHTARLNFVEFFSKFYQGGGREFRPFKKRNEYVIMAGEQKP